MLTKTRIVTALCKLIFRPFTTRKNCWDSFFLFSLVLCYSVPDRCVLSVSPLGNPSLGWCVPWGWILGQNQDKSLKSFPPCYSQSSLPWDFYFFKLTQPLTVSRVPNVRCICCNYFITSVQSYCRCRKLLPAINYLLLVKMCIDFFHFVHIKCLYEITEHRHCHVWYDNSNVGEIV